MDISQFQIIIAIARAFPRYFGHLRQHQDDLLSLRLAQRPHEGPVVVVSSSGTVVYPTTDGSRVCHFSQRSRPA